MTGRLREEVEVKEEAKDLRQEEGRDESKVLEAESNAIVRCQDERITTDDPIPVEPLLVFRGQLHDLPVEILKDDGCNTNVVGIDFLKKKKARKNIE